MAGEPIVMEEKITEFQQGYIKGALEEQGKITKVTRVEVVNYAHPNPYERAYAYYTKKGEWVQLDYQDDGRTLKIFINKPAK